jgi:hypothetical protein
MVKKRAKRDFKLHVPSFTENDKENDSGEKPVCVKIQHAADGTAI